MSKLEPRCSELFNPSLRRVEAVSESALSQLSGSSWRESGLAAHVKVQSVIFRECISYLAS